MPHHHNVGNLNIDEYFFLIRLPVDCNSEIKLTNEQVPIFLNLINKTPNKRYELIRPFNKNSIVLKNGSRLVMGCAGEDNFLKYVGASKTPKKVFISLSRLK